MQSPPSDALRTLLTEAGYTVRDHTNAWHECLAYRGPERWVGRGMSEDDALQDVFSQLLPSHFARVLLDLHLTSGATAGGEPPSSSREGLTINLEEPAARALDHGAESGAPLVPPHEELPVAAEPAQNDGAPQPAEPAAQEPPAAAQEPQMGAEALPALSPKASPQAEQAAPEAAPARPVEVAPVAEPTPVAQLQIPRPPPPEPEKSLRQRSTEALENVDKLLNGIEDRLPVLARQCADRQRLHMLVWICRARAIEESLPGVREVEHSVARVARRLTEIGKMFWPGSVRALQLSARPADVRREMHANWASEPSNWIEATSLAERLLAEHMTKSVDLGLDEDGWADTAARTPKPTEPDAMFEEVDAELKTFLVPPGEVPNGRLGELTGAELEALVNAARRLRWVRGYVKNHLDWGIAMGRLRRALPGLGDRAARVRDVVDNRLKPSQSWAKQLGQTDAEAPESEVTESPTKLLADLPAAAESKDATMAWLIRAFDVLNTPVLVDNIGPLREQIGAFSEDDLNHPDRRVRRRLRDLVKKMAEAPVTQAPPSPVKIVEPEPEESGTDETVGSRVLDALSARVRAQTEGRRALFVSNREDPELGARLSELLGITIAWCDGSLRRVQAQCERIARGSYDLILSATGFQVHGVDSALARAASAAGVPYVRVNRGRPVACVQAIAREFGLTSADQPNVASGGGRI